MNDGNFLEPRTLSLVHARNTQRGEMERRSGDDTRRESRGRREGDAESVDALAAAASFTLGTEDENVSLVLKVLEDARTRDRAEHDRRIGTLEEDIKALQLQIKALELYAAKQRMLGSLAGAGGGVLSSAGVWALVRWLMGN